MPKNLWLRVVQRHTDAARDLASDDDAKTLVRDAERDGSRIAMATMDSAESELLRGFLRSTEVKFDERSVADPEPGDRVLAVRVDTWPPGLEEPADWTAEDFAAALLDWRVEEVVAEKHDTEVMQSGDEAVDAAPERDLPERDLQEEDAEAEASWDEELGPDEDEDE